MGAIADEIITLSKEAKEVCKNTSDILRNAFKKAMDSSDVQLATRYAADVEALNRIINVMDYTMEAAERMNMCKGSLLLLEYCKEKASIDLKLIPEMGESVQETIANLENILSRTEDLICLSQNSLRITFSA